MRVKIGPMPPVLFVALSSVVGVFAQSVTPEPPSKPRYLVVHHVDMSRFQEALPGLSMQGYRVISLSHGRRDWSSGETMILERLPKGITGPNYRIVKTPALAADLERELNMGAYLGFHVVLNGAFLQTESEKSSLFLDVLLSATHSDHEVHRSTIRRKATYVLMQQGSDRWTKCDYLVPRTGFDLEDTKARRAIAEGRRMVGAVYGDSPFLSANMFLVMEHCEAESTTTGTQPPTQANRRPYRVIKTNDDAKAQKQLHKAASQGYRISLSEGGILVLEHAASPAVKREYRIIRTGNILTLEKELNSTKGFCMVAETMSLTEKVQDKSRRIFVVLERKSEGASDCHYRVLTDRDHSFTHLQDDVNAAAEKGYQIKGVTDDEADTAVIMESSEEKAADSGSGDRN